MNDIDIISLLEGAESFSDTVEIIKRNDTIITAGDLCIDESVTVIESISFGQRSLNTEDIVEGYSADLSWIF